MIHFFQLNLSDLALLGVYRVQIFLKLDHIRLALQEYMESYGCGRWWSSCFKLALQMSPSTARCKMSMEHGDQSLKICHHSTVQYRDTNHDNMCPIGSLQVQDQKLRSRRCLSSAPNHHTNHLPKHAMTVTSHPGDVCL